MVAGLLRSDPRSSCTSGRSVDAGVNCGFEGTCSSVATLENRVEYGAGKGNLMKTTEHVLPNTFALEPASMVGAVLGERSRIRDAARESAFIRLYQEARR
jgi:hypothetical protein